MEKGYLDTLQVFVTTEIGDTKAIRETYTYTFTYDNSAITTVALKEQNQSLTLADAQRSFKLSIRCLLRGLQDMPRLPGTSVATTQCIF